MRLAAAVVVAGYAAVVMTWGWPGLLAGLVHAGLLLAAIRR